MSRPNYLPDGAAGLSDHEIGQILGITRSRVFQIRERAVRKLREAILADAEMRELASEICGIELDPSPSIPQNTP